MSKKPKPAASVKQSTVSDSWIDALESITINEENWCCMIIMIIETLPEHTDCIALFDEAAEKGSRKAIHLLTFREVINSIKTFSKVDQDKCPVAQGVFHHANKLISQGEKLDGSLVAKLVKYLIYRAKTEAIARSQRESNHENEVDQELQAMLTVGKVESQPSVKEAKSKKSAQSVEAKPMGKTNTHLRKHGEEWKDKVYIDDAPKGGPDLYIILTGFRNPDLPLEFIKAGIPLNCIMKIKRPGDVLEIKKDSQTNVQTDHNKSPNSTNMSFKTSDVTRNTLYNFWSNLEKSSNKPENLDYFSSVIFRTFCPPEIPAHYDEEEAAELKKDLYDRVSCIVYDLYDLQRLHIDYIRSMKLENVPKEISEGRKFNVYEVIMDAVPAECASVEVILQAMLAQVQEDIRDDKPSPISPADTKSEVPAKSKLNVDSFHSKESVHKETFGTSYHLENPKDQLSYHRARLQELNLQYGIKAKNNNPEMQKKDLEVILEDDELRSKTYHVLLNYDIVQLVNPAPSSLADFAVRSLRDPRVMNLWKHHEDICEDTRKKNRYHINKLTGCFGGLADPCSLIHYLHLQLFDKMIHGTLNRAPPSCKDRDISIIVKDCTPNSMLSDPFLLSTKTVQDDPTFAPAESPISNLRGFGSDSIIDYSKTTCDIFECPELFELTDTREMLQPGFLQSWQEKLCATQSASPSVADFTDVHILSKNVFLQIVHECLRKFKGLQSRYVEITDSVLLYFGKEEGSPEHDHSCNRKVFKIVTPVCLRNFCEYVMNEESEWVRETEKGRAGSWATDTAELTRKFSQHSDIDTVKAATFTDDDFILPNSLKGQARRKHQEELSEKTEALEKMSKKSDKTTSKTEKDVKDIKGKKNKSAPRSSGEKNTKETRTVDIESGSLSAHKVHSLRCARDGEPYKFVGYDLGNRRVHLTTHSETFTSLDGTLVQVDIDEWLYGEKRVGIGINLSGCFLKLEHTIGNQDSYQMPFHLITKNGVVMAFHKRQIEEHSASEVNQNYGPCFEFRASWPSSLLVEPVRDDSFENSFYILQRYISKGPECEPVSRENYRKFLRNGTVLKFFDDDAVEVMRPNGTIVRCLKFEKFPDPRVPDFEREGELTKAPDEISRHKKSKSLMSTRGHRKASSPRKQSRRPSEDDHIKKKLVLPTPLDNIIDGIHSPQEEGARAKITRYTALEHDGRHYEVVNGELSRVFDASVVRTSTDFEVSEKLTRREDGMQSILNSMGELVVSFSDGTRITTGFVIEDEPLICDWSDEQFIKYFVNVPRSSRPSEGVLSSRLSAESRSGSYRSTGRESRTNGLRKLLDDAFVSILMTCRMEHECYATVAYDQSEQCCKLSMPDEVVIGITREGLYDISIGRKIELRISNDNLEYLSRFNENGQQSISTSNYYFRQPKLWDENERILFVTVDSLGKVFKVYADGSIVREGDTSVDKKNQSNFGHEQHRLFAMNRDFTAYEYIHKSKSDEYKKKISSTERSSVISVAIPGGARGLEYRLFLNPLEPKNYSKMWLQKIPEFKGTNHRARPDLSRSTYSTPYNVLFPFGRNSYEVRKNTWKVPLIEPIQDDHSDVLTLTVLQRIAEEGKNILIELQKALACYWPTAIKQLGAYRTLRLKNGYHRSEKLTENWVRDLALGFKSNITLEKYLSGMAKNQPKLPSGQSREAAKNVRLSQQKTDEIEEMQWYKKCIREKITLPYFKSIQGSCFLWIMSCVDEALELVEK